MKIVCVGEGVCVCMYASVCCVCERVRERKIERAEREVVYTIYKNQCCRSINKREKIDIIGTISGVGGNCYKMKK